MNAHKSIIITVIIVILALAIYGTTSIDKDRYSYDGVDWGASFDWGDGYYWNTNSHSVQKKPW